MQVRVIITPLLAPAVKILKDALQIVINKSEIFSKLVVTLQSTVSETLVINGPILFKK